MEIFFNGSIKDLPDMVKRKGVRLHITKVNET